ncbi:MAG: purine-binding chemotaxis protein CheW [Chlamydiales bacterium]|nr:purine-binding chemotaxis protein CheW [Chlamydiia bacterium]MCP5508687.1 purine-binding chemotaxis protein CheW [Chlamydiales bacterium]
MDDKQSLLQKRADKLAEKAYETQESHTTIDVVRFKLADECYALEPDYIEEVYPLKEITPLPCTPPFVLGLINVRRRITTVIDLKYFFGLPGTVLTPQSKVIILRDNEHEFAIVTDGIESVATIDPEALQPALPTLTDIRQQFLRGITADKLIVLDGKKLLTNENLIVKA